MKKLPKNSFYTGELAKGCIYCGRGSKMVLLVTGLCNANCFYCPLSEKKKNKDVIYANEKIVKKDDDIIREAELIEAEGTGITGGDPLITISRTIKYIKMLKEYFGKEHHIHLYTSILNIEKIRKAVFCAIMMIGIVFAIVVYANGLDDGGVSSNRDIVLDFSFKEPVIEKVTIFNETYDRVKMPSLPNYGNVGEPILPVKPSKCFIASERYVGIY